IIDPYVPPEGDARLTPLSKDGLKQKMEKLKQTAASQLAYVPPAPLAWRTELVLVHLWGGRSVLFPTLLFHLCFACSFNKQKLHSLVTERCYPEMVRGNRYKTIRWSFVESLEPPRVVHIRCNSIINRGNIYGQVTVRMHTR
ncbi:RM45 protein, partial [Halcyon senegalensis]|nr:RM45 protein [Halcyon senegalensis]